MLICGHDYSLYVDYDRGNYHLLDFAGKVTYMRERVDRDLIRPSRFLLRGQPQVAVGLVVPGLICSGISAAGTFLNGGPAPRGQDRRVFADFVRRYMSPELRQPLAHPTDARIADHVDWLYCYVRSGLSHAFALEWGHIEGPPALNASYIGQSRVGQPQINQNQLVEDFTRGWSQYLADALADPLIPLGQNFERRFDGVFCD